MGLVFGFEGDFGGTFGVTLGSMLAYEGHHGVTLGSLWSRSGATWGPFWVHGGDFSSLWHHYGTIVESLLLVWHHFAIHFVPPWGHLWSSLDALFVQRKDWVAKAGPRGATPLSHPFGYLLDIAFVTFPFCCKRYRF